MPPSSMQVVLAQNVGSLGKAGDLVSVQNGYMVNYLIPQGLAKPATKEILAYAPLFSVLLGRRS
jgi:ribosomal protein L9